MCQYITTLQEPQQCQESKESQLTQKVIKQINFLNKFANSHLDTEMIVFIEDTIETQQAQSKYFTLTKQETTALYKNALYTNYQKYEYPNNNDDNFTLQQIEYINYNVNNINDPIFNLASYIKKTVIITPTTTELSFYILLDNQNKENNNFYLINTANEIIRFTPNELQYKNNLLSLQELDGQSIENKILINYLISSFTDVITLSQKTNNDFLKPQAIRFNFHTNDENRIKFFQDQAVLLENEKLTFLSTIVINKYNLDSLKSQISYLIGQDQEIIENFY